MPSVTLITSENFKSYIGKRIEIEINCRSGGIMYPDHNTLEGMSDSCFHFIADIGTDDEQKWQWTIHDDSDCSIRVWDYEEYQNFYNVNDEKV